MRERDLVELNGLFTPEWRPATATISLFDNVFEVRHRTLPLSPKARPELPPPPAPTSIDYLKLLLDLLDLLAEAVEVGWPI